ncbi:n-alkane-inducible cytochrome p450 [Staphylotrichum tortipilum]|uniref:N-alkane-inducible cytochrome p450 n=1 Tax=Staphylotrichum tortipilum TaxID=2831512 RepID=A0AAN6RNH4_9PEZI|nr:n-alkane-inducible cytochrome p450 [Staphylotrichum longicolle]
METSHNAIVPLHHDASSLTPTQGKRREALRLYPPIPLNIRVANKDTVLPMGGGPDGTAPIFVPAGQEVAYPVFLTHRRHGLQGEDADLFRPERWRDVRPRFQYLPFNTGPRICPGQQFALLKTLLKTSYVVVRFQQECVRLEGPSDKPQRCIENY